MVNISKLSLLWQKAPNGNINPANLGYVRPDGVIVFQSRETALDYIQNCYKHNKQNRQKSLAQLIPSEGDITNGMAKLINKLKFINKILGKDAKTLKPVSTTISDAQVDIMMDKTKKGQIKINISSHNDNISVENNPLSPQNLDMILDDKKGRMISGNLNTGICNLNFERNQKTGQRKGCGDNFFLIPNLRESGNVEFNRERFYWQSRTDNTISLIFHRLFSDLSLVRPKTNMLK